jgi:hypothetical protein
MSKRRLTLVSRVALQRIVRTAVNRTLGRGAEVDLADRLVREMVHAIRDAGRSVQGMSKSDVLQELERANHELVQARDRAREELELQRQAKDQRLQLAKEHAGMARIVDAGAASREEHAQALVGLAFARAERDGLSLEVLRGEMNALVQDVARRERRELLDSLIAEHDRQIDVLERRLAKLNHALEVSEAALRELAARKGLDDGLASIYRTVQGLPDDEPGAARKRLLLEAIFRANAELRELRAGRLEAGRALHVAAG